MPQEMREVPLSPGRMCSWYLGGTSFRLKQHSENTIAMWSRGCSAQTVGGEQAHVPSWRVGQSWLVYMPNRHCHDTHTHTHAWETEGGSSGDESEEPSVIRVTLQAVPIEADSYLLLDRGCSTLCPLSQRAFLSSPAAPTFTALLLISYTLWCPNKTKWIPKRDDVCPFIVSSFSRLSAGTVFSLFCTTRRIILFFFLTPWSLPYAWLSV